VLKTWDEVTPAIWQEIIDVNLTGVWNTMTATVPHLIAAGGGSIICTGSTTRSRACRSSRPTSRPSTAWSGWPR
jgi:NADP-dependent 3-hydroxy acid dehydrogenase YdfG